MRETIRWGLAVAVGFGVGTAAWADDPATAMPGAKPDDELQTIPVNVPGPEPVGIRDVKMSWGGFIKVDVLYSSFSEGDVASPSAGRDFYVPGAIPVSGGGGESADFLDYHAKETRLWFRADGKWDEHTVGAYLEVDFIVNPGAGNERVTNAYNPGLRRAYITWNNWLAGQDWTTFQNVAALPEGLDFIGPTEGTVFGRQPLVRYTWGDWQFAAENPETSLTVMRTNEDATTTTTTGNVTGDAQLPDVVARYSWKPSFGEFVAAGLVRELQSEDAPNNPATTEDSSIGYGLSVSGKVPVFAADDVRFMATGGRGIGRYVGINTVDDAGVFVGQGSLEPISLLAGYVAYRHPWNEQWRSTAYISCLEADTEVGATGSGVTSGAQSAAANLLYSPMPKLTVGAELRYATRELENGNDGDLTRLQLGAKFVF